MNPIAVAWDTRGRLWVAENFTLAERTRQFESRLRDRVLVLADTDGDGTDLARARHIEKLDGCGSIAPGALAPLARLPRPTDLGIIARVQAADLRELSGSRSLDSSGFLLDVDPGSTDVPPPAGLPPKVSWTPTKDLWAEVMLAWAGESDLPA